MHFREIKSTYDTEVNTELQYNYSTIQY